MLMDDVERYLTIRRALGFQLINTEARLRRYALFAAALGEDHVRAESVISWANQAPTPHARHIWCRDLRRFARFLHGEDPRHETVVGDPFPNRWRRPLPYIYSQQEIASIVAAALQIRATFPLKPAIIATAIGLIAATGMRVSECLRLRLDDVRLDGQLTIRETKFRKSRLVPLHPTVRVALDDYLAKRRRRAGSNPYLFPSPRRGHLSYPTLLTAFHRAQQQANIKPFKRYLPRIHDLRHTFATRALERCANDRTAVARNHVALSTYLGHSCMEHTYWYLEATPELMASVATAAERLMWEVKP